MAETGEFRFEIEDLTPMTLSMKRLHDYLPHLVELFGSQDDVHLLRIDEGSAVPCIYPKNRAITRVQQRLLSIKTGHGSGRAYRAVDSLNELLAEDNTSAILKSPSGVVIEFPGNKASQDPIIGPVSESCELQGELFQVGGRDETISVYIRSENEIFICTATRDQARDISQYLFRSVRVSGEGKWLRRENGRWKLVSFVMSSFKHLDNPGLRNTFAALRQLGRALGVKAGGLPSDDDEDL